jgi:hypothetical protein
MAEQIGAELQARNTRQNKPVGVISEAMTSLT